MDAQSAETLTPEELGDQTVAHPDQVDFTGTDKQMRAAHPMRDRYNLDTPEGVAAALEECHEHSEELANIDANKRAMSAFYGTRAEAMREDLAKFVKAAEAEIAGAETQRSRLLVGFNRAAKWRMDRIDEVRQEPAFQKHLRLSRKKKSLELIGGTITFHDNATRTDWARDHEGKRFDEAMEGAVGDLYDLGLADIWDAMMPARPRKLAVAVTKGAIALDDDGVAWWQFVVDGELTPELDARIEADGGSYGPYEKSGAGEVLSWTVRFRARWEQKNEAGVVVRKCDSIMQRYTPQDRGEEPYTLEFVPLKEGETDGAG